MSGQQAPLAPPRSLRRVDSSVGAAPKSGPGGSAAVRRVLHLIAGAMVLAIAGAIELTQTRALHGSYVQLAAAASGLGLCLMGFAPAPTSLRLASQKLSISIVTFALLLLCLEGVCRVVRYDFVGEERAWRRIPLFFRWPVVPTGEAFFRRSGPEQWTGRPLFERLAQLHVSPNPYRTDTPITAKYDAAGFRNDPALNDWEIAVAGDSFTELGYLKQDELFTTILGKDMGLRVRNLGTSYTGPLSQLSYLRSYGVAPSTRRVAIVFFEGNDLDDLQGETALLNQFRNTGLRPVREFRKQTSLLRTLYQMVLQHSKLPRPDWPQDPAPKSWVTGQFRSSQGAIPISLTTTPPSSSDVVPERKQELGAFFEQFSEFGKQHGVEVWSVYMPCKERVVHGMVAFSPDAPEAQKAWQPTDLPEMVSQMARSRGVKFMDLTPALVAETTQNGTLLYNGIWDTHLNAAGSRVVGREMARVFSSNQ